MRSMVQKVRDRWRGLHRPRVGDEAFDLAAQRARLDPQRLEHRHQGRTGRGERNDDVFGTEPRVTHLEREPEPRGENLHGAGRAELAGGPRSLA